MLQKEKKGVFATEAGYKGDIYQVVQKEKKKPFLVSTPYMLRYTDESLFTKEFMCNVKAIIGEGSEFKKKSIPERRRISDELSELFDLKTVWKHVVKKVNIQVE